MIFILKNSPPNPNSTTKLTTGQAPRFRIFAGGLLRRRRRQNAFGLIQEYCTNFAGAVPAMVESKASGGWRNWQTRQP